MFWFDVLVALGVALVLSTLCVSLLGWRRAGSAAAGRTALFFFVILFLAAWAGGVWLHPFGPVLLGGRLFPFLFAGLIVALVLAAAAPTPGQAWRLRQSLDAGQPGTSTLSAGQLAAERERRDEAALATGFGVFFWALVAVLGLVILLAYLA